MLETFGAFSPNPRFPFRRSFRHQNVEGFGKRWCLFAKFATNRAVLHQLGGRSTVEQTGCIFVGVTQILLVTLTIVALLLGLLSLSDIGLSPLDQKSNKPLLSLQPRQNI